MDEAAYQKKYYREKRRLLSLKRKIKYRQDPEYRERMKERAKQRHAELARERPLLFRGSKVAEMIQMPPQTVYSWHQKGVFPTIILSDKGHPLFTPQQAFLIQEVREQFPAKRFGKRILEEFKEKLRERWEEVDDQERGEQDGGNANSHPN